MEDLDIKIDPNTSLREASGTVFMQWVLNKVGKSNLSNNYTSEIIMLANAYPGRVMADTEKIKLLEKMKKAGILLQ